MGNVYTTEITSESIPSDNPIHQRLLRPYVLVSGWLKGDVLEVGCGEGRGVELMMNASETYTAIDKIEPVINRLKEKYPKGNFYSGHIPPFTMLQDSQFDYVVSFQVIEHIEDDRTFLREIHRVLRPGGKAFITTPNRPMSLSRNPWHVREYTGQELSALAAGIFPTVEMRGISGNEKVMTYYQRNKQSVDRMMRWDFLDLQHRLPASWLRLPYEIMNRMNRKKLKASADELVASIRQDDYLLSDHANQSLDLFLIVTK